MQVHGDLGNRRETSTDELLQSLDWCDFNKFLAEVVAKLVGHDIGHEVKHHVNERSSEATLAFI